MSDVPDWVPLARVAAMAHAGRCGLAGVEWLGLGHAGPRTKVLTLRFTEDVSDADYFTPDVVDADLAEYLMLAFAELHAERAAAEHPSSPVDWARWCPSCAAEVGAPCTPTHAGELPPGRWCHPLRAERDLGADRRAVMEFARSSPRSNEVTAKIARGIEALLAERQVLKGLTFVQRYAKPIPMMYTSRRVADEIAVARADEIAVARADEAVAREAEAIQGSLAATIPTISAPLRRALDARRALRGTAP